MPGSLVEFEVQGFDELVKRLEALTPLLRRKYVLTALKKGADVVKQSAVLAVPVLSAPIYRHGELYRKPGTVRDAIAVRTSKDVARTGDVGAIVNVVPAKGANRGANSPTDAFFWRFLEFGTRKMKARPYLRVAAQQLDGAALEAIKASLAPDIQNLNLNFDAQVSS